MKFAEWYKENAEPWLSPNWDGKRAGGQFEAAVQRAIEGANGLFNLSYRVNPTLEKNIYNLGNVDTDVLDDLINTGKPIPSHIHLRRVADIYDMVKSFQKEKERTPTGSKAGAMNLERSRQRILYMIEDCHQRMQQLIQALQKLNYSAAAEYYQEYGLPVIMNMPELLN